MCLICTHTYMARYSKGQAESAGILLAAAIAYQISDERQ